MNEKVYILATDASSKQENTKHGNLWISCASFSVFDLETSEHLATNSYFLIDEGVNFTEAFAINMALYHFTNPSVQENRGAIIYSDSVYALGQTLDYLTQFREERKRPKGLKSANGFKHVCYNNALLAYTSFYPLQFRYQPGHPEKKNYNPKIISEQAEHENYKIGLVASRENMANSIRQPMYANQYTDRIANCELQNKIHSIRQIVNSLEYLPDRKDRYFPIMYHANQIQSLTPICYREDAMKVWGIRPEVIQTTYEMKNKPILEGVKLNGDPL